MGQAGTRSLQKNTFFSQREIKSSTNNSNDNNNNVNSTYGEDSHRLKKEDIRPHPESFASPFPHLHLSKTHHQSSDPEKEHRPLISANASHGNNRVQRNTLHTFAQSDAMMHPLSPLSPIRFGVHPPVSPLTHDGALHSSLGNTTTSEFTPSHIPAHGEMGDGMRSSSTGGIRGGEEPKMGKFTVYSVDPSVRKEGGDGGVILHGSGVHHRRASGTSMLTQRSVGAGMTSTPSISSSSPSSPLPLYPTIIHYKAEGVKDLLLKNIPVQVAVETMNWKRLPMTRSTDSFFAVVSLPPGSHNYRFIVNQREVVDYTQPLAPLPLPPLTSSCVVMPGSHQKAPVVALSHSVSVPSAKQEEDPLPPSRHGVDGCDKTTGDATLYPVRLVPFSDTPPSGAAALSSNDAFHTDPIWKMTTPHPPGDGSPANYLVLDETLLRVSRRTVDSMQPSSSSSDGRAVSVPEPGTCEKWVHPGGKPMNSKTTKDGEKEGNLWGQEEKMFEETRRFPPLLPLHLRYTPLNTPPTPFRCSSDGKMLVLNPNDSSTRPAPEQLPCPLSVTIQHVYFQRREDHVVLGMTTRYENKCATIVYYTTASNVLPQ